MEDSDGFRWKKAGKDMEQQISKNEAHHGALAAAKACMKALELKLEAAEIRKVR